jgi:hypothetical protein
MPFAQSTLPNVNHPPESLCKIEHNESTQL